MLLLLEIKPILQDFYSYHDTDSKKEKIKLIETAARLIREDIKVVKTLNSVCPGFDSLATEECINFLPQSLRLFLTGLTIGKENQMKFLQLGKL